MKICLHRTAAGFIPDSAPDEERLASVRIGSVIYGDFRQPRNPRHHRKAFALLHKIHDNLPEHMPMTFGKFYSYMKIAAGAVDDVIGHDGKLHYVVKSLSFADMDQVEFEQIYSQFITVAYERLGMDWVLTEFA